MTKNILIIFLGFIMWLQQANAAEMTYQKMAEIARTDKNVVFYFVSAAMPLSMRGLPNIKRATKKSDYRLVVVNDPFSPVSEIDSATPKIALSKEMLNLGVTLHYPSIVQFHNGKLCGNSVLGYKSVAAYDKTIQLLETQCGKSVALNRNNVQNYRSSNVTVVKTDDMPSGTGYYYNVVNDHWISGYWGSEYSMLYDRTTGKTYDTYPTLDATPTPDGRFLTFPYYRGHTSFGGLTFFTLEKFLSDPQHDINTVDAVYTDSNMDDQYQSIGVLSENASEVIYRVLTAWYTSISIRDYKYDLVSKKFTPLNYRGNPCVGNLSVPRLSKDGLYLSAVDNQSQGLTIFNLGKDGDSCKVVKYIGIGSGKALFDYPGRSRLAFVASKNGTTSAYVYNYSSDDLTKVYDAPSGTSLQFPQFYPNGNIAVLTTGSGGVKLLELKVE